MTARDTPAARSGGRVFVGRERELKELLAGFADAAAGSGRLFMVAGEPGIGKTRLAIELAAHAAPQGARILWGRCWEAGGAPAFWPWLQILRACTRTSDPDTLYAQLGAGGVHLANLLPELRERCPQLPAPAGIWSVESEHARFQLFDALATFLKNASAQHPLVIVVDDIHAADQPSLLLLQFVARELRDMAVLVIATYREVEVRRARWLASLLGQLAREGRQLPLRGLSATDAALFITQIAQESPAAKVVDAIYRATEGNPFFIDEVVRLLVAEGRLSLPGQIGSSSLRIPDAVREAIRRRLDPLSDEAITVLRIASVFGREFDHSPLQQVCAVSTDQLLAHLADAAAAGAVIEAPGVAGWYAFSHPLIRETLYEDLPAARRLQLHRQIGETLEQTYRSNLEPHVAELAHHFLRAVPAADIGKALDYAARAGQRALALLAYEDAADWYEQALHVWQSASDHSQEQRCELLLALGDAQRHAGESVAARATFMEAARSARGLGSAAKLALAALGVGWAGAETGVVDEILVDLLEEALEALPDEDSALRTGVLGRLAVTLYFSKLDARRARLSQQAVEMARRLGDLQALAAALMTRHFAIWGPGSASERVAIATELMQIGARAANLDMVLEGRDWRITDLLEMGDVQTARAETEAYTQLVEELRLPRCRWHATVLRAMYALFEGRYAESERLATLALAQGERVQMQNAAQFFAVQLVTLRREQGRLDEIEASVKHFADQYPALPIWRCGLAFVYSELGRVAEAQREFERLAAHAFADLPHDTNWLAAVTRLAEVCAFVNDAARASTLYDMLLPYAAGNVVVATGVACYGSVSHYLGLLAATLQRWDAAAEHFERAIAMNAQMGAHPAVAYVQFGYARMLLAAATAEPGRRDHNARQLLDRALATARHLRMQSLEAKVIELIRSVGGQHASSRAPTTADAPSGAPANVFRREGDYWTLAYGGAVFRLKDSKGLRYLNCLLRHPGRELHTTELVAAARDPREYGGITNGPVGRNPGQVTVGLGDAGPILDAQARATYKRRIHELEEELEEARSFNDIGRAEHAQREIDGLALELAAAVGLGGRDRRAGSLAERSRVSVTKAITVALKRIAAHHPGLASHLSSSIKTGTFCAYTPDSRAPVTWLV